MKIIVFEDEGVEQLAPITLSRPAYAIRCGGFRLVDWLQTLGAPIYGAARPHLIPLQQRDFPEVQTLDAAQAPHDDAYLLLINARTAPSASAASALKEIVRKKQTGIAYWKESVAVAAARAKGSLSELGGEKIEPFLRQVQEQNPPPLDVELPLLDEPHDVVRLHMEIFPENLEARLATGNYREVQPGVFAAGNVKIADQVVCDVQHGPIVLEENVSVGPFTYLKGPIHAGAGAKILEHAAIKDAVSLGHTTKVGGEVEASVIEPFSNKQHYGFLGHSYIGSWVNLGAGTSNSDLKNTYGAVTVERPAGQPKGARGDGKIPQRTLKIFTGMQFFGCVMGDYVKSAINTSIFTGKLIGACSMLYGYVTANVPSFVNYARTFGEVTEMAPEVVISMQQRMFSRRGREQRPCDVQLIHDMYQLTQNERAMLSRPPNL